MAKELGEETKFTVSIKTLIAVAVAIATFVGGYYKLHSEIEAAKELPKPGKGVYIVDPGDASAKETWPPGRNEYKMKEMEYEISSLGDDKKALNVLQENYDKRLEGIKQAGGTVGIPRGTLFQVSTKALQLEGTSPDQFPL